MDQQNVVLQKPFFLALTCRCMWNMWMHRNEINKPAKDFGCDQKFSVKGNIRMSVGAQALIWGTVKGGSFLFLLMFSDTPLNPNKKGSEVDKKRGKNGGLIAVSQYVVATGFNCLCCSPLLSSRSPELLYFSKQSYYCIWMWSSL